jgi:hypothetical protein
VLAREARGVEIVAERGTNAAHLVRRDLLALTAAAEHDAALGVAVGDRPRDRQTDRRVIHGRFAVGAVIVHDVAKPFERDALRCSFR